MELLNGAAVPNYDATTSPSRTTSSCVTTHRNKEPCHTDDHTHAKPDGFTVEEAVEKIGFGKFQMILLVIIGLLVSAEAMEFMLIAVVTPPLRCEWYLSELQVALVSVGTFLGFAVGSTIGGILADTYGRLTVSRLGAFFLIWYGLLTAISPYYEWVVFCRTIVGLSIGFCMQSFTLLSEYCPVKYRAKILVLPAVAWTLGSLFEVFLASVIMPWLGWRSVLLFTAIPGAVSLAFLFFIPESARYLVAHGRHVEAETILNSMAKTNNSHLPPGKLVVDKVGRRSIGDLFNEEFRMTTSINWFLWFGASFVGYGTILLNSDILEKDNLCDSAADSSEILQDAEVCHCQPHTFYDYASMAISTCGEFLVVPVNMLLLDRIGRRRCMHCYLFMIAIFYLFLNICMNKVQYTAIMLCIRVFLASLFSLNYIYTVEVYPTTTRGIGLGSANSWARIGAMVTPFCGQVLLAHSRMSAILVYSITAAVCGLVSMALPIETMGREMKQSFVATDQNR